MLCIRLPKNNHNRTQVPQLNTNLRSSHTFRFLSTSGAATTLYDKDILMFAGTAGSSSRLNAGFCSARLISVEIWSPQSAAGSATTAKIEWLGDRVGRREVSDTTLSSARPAHVRGVPPPRTTASMWQSIDNNDNAALCSIVAPVNSVIDVKIAFVWMDGGGVPSTYVATYSSLSTGAMYYSALDSHGSGGTGTNRYTPVGLNPPV